MTGHVTGFGGVFFRARDPKALDAWYRTHLGVPMVDFWPQAKGNAVLAAFDHDTEYWPADKQWMMNFRVTDLDGLIEKLTQTGIPVERRADWDIPDIGRFARIVDPEGTQIELWEPQGSGAAE